MNKRLFGLLGNPLEHSFSPSYFKKKFEQEHISDAEYLPFERSDLFEFVEEARDNEHLVGFNVTIPFKEGILPLLDSISDEASYVGAVNTVKRLPDGKLIGYNTDVFGFHHSLEPLLRNNNSKALVLGTGGASKAVVFVLKELGISPIVVSRRKGAGHVTYEQVSETMVQNYSLIVNATPLGMYPNIEATPAIPYTALTKMHLCYDLIYNPKQTKFLKIAQQQGARTKNGLEMLHLQAEKSWEIWNKIS